MSARQIAYVAVLAALYVAIGQVTGRIPNPMIRGGSNLALNMTVVVIAGALLGPGPGALVGFFGTLLNWLSPAGNPFELAAVIPHTIMGLTAGLLARIGQPFAAFAIVVGHLLNILAFILAGLIPLNQLAAAVPVVGLLAETVIDLVIIWLAVAALRPVVRSAPA